MNFFKKIHKNGESFTILLPPPNITGKLHHGHYQNFFFQEVIAAYKASKGYKINWKIAVDHAGIATFQKVKQALESGQDLNDALEKYTNDSKQSLYEQLKSFKTTEFLDITQPQFTLNQEFKTELNELITKLNNDSLLFSAFRPVDFCKHCNTTLSDIEIEITKCKKIMYIFSYKLCDSVGSLLVCTTKPDSMVYDTALCINPLDSRYRHLIGKYVYSPVYESQGQYKKICIVSNPSIDISFGSGINKLTPILSKSDYNIMHDHKTFPKNSLNSTINNTELEEIWKQQYTKISLGEFEIDSEKHTCYRCKQETIIENRKEVFIDLAKIIKKHLLPLPTFFPNNEKYKNEILNKWITRIEPWCITRNIPYGFGLEFNNITYPSLDTWLTSALWAHTVNKNKIDLIVSGSDILFFWIIRMLLISRVLNPKYNIENVLFHGIIRDKNHIKLSKSLGNFEDINDLIKTHGHLIIRLAILNNIRGDKDLILDLNSEAEKAKKIILKIDNIVSILNTIFYDKQNFDISDAITCELINFINKFYYSFDEHMENLDLFKAYSSVLHAIYYFSNEYLENLKTEDTKYGTLLCLIFRFILEKLNILVPIRNQENIEQFFKKLESYVHSDNMHELFIRIETKIKPLLPLFSEFRKLRTEFKLRPYSCSSLISLQPNSIIKKYLTSLSKLSGLRLIEVSSDYTENADTLCIHFPVHNVLLMIDTQSNSLDNEVINRLLKRTNNTLQEIETKTKKLSETEIPEYKLQLQTEIEELKNTTKIYISTKTGTENGS